MMVGTEALEVLPELALAAGDIQIYKRYLSGFSFNDLDYTMRCIGIDTVLITARQRTTRYSGPPPTPFSCTTPFVWWRTARWSTARVSRPR